MAHRRNAQSGVALMGALVFLLLLTLLGGLIVESAQTQKRRSDEEQLLFAGDQIRRAILSYYNTVPTGRGRSLPDSLDSLLEDRRFPTPMRHLRRLYPDPMTGNADWEFVREGGGIVGVHSRASQKPFKQAEFSTPYETFSGATSYESWVFRIQR
ncbi:type II secretion system protein [Ramlibacter humi]|uniref:Type II secretion system protein n=1 Tax=Ramlibacter humi TaxID=2530451 RepID=A0A4Z0BCD0_9BURK|nr:type II secretion system protein [Ramlibacter humi]TFY96360.1 type II secretion system protein [Ramlibacter humi]